MILIGLVEGIDMIDELISLLVSYLRCETDLDAIGEWIAINAFDPQNECSDLIDQVTVELAYINDGVSNQKHFRSRMADILASTSAEYTNP